MRVRLYGPADVLQPVVEGVENIELIDAPLSIAKAPDPALAVRGNPDAIRRAAGRATRSTTGRRTHCASSNLMRGSISV